MVQYYDTSRLSETERAVVNAAVTNLLASSEYRSILEKAYAQYGTLAITAHGNAPTQAVTMAPLKSIHLNLKDIERMRYLSTDADGVEQLQGFALEDVIAHETFHFAHDKDEMRDLQFRHMAGLSKEFRQYSSEESMVKTIEDDYAHYPAYFGYANAIDLIDAALRAQNPLDSNEYAALVEVPAIAATNRILSELYGQLPRSEDPLDHGAFSRRTKFMETAQLCRPDVNRVVESPTEVELGELEPCAYVYVPGKQESLAR